MVSYYKIIAAFVLVIWLLVFSENPALAEIALTIHPLPYVTDLNMPVGEAPSNVQIITKQATEVQNNLSLGDMLLKNADGVNVNDTAGNPFQPDITYHGFTASPLLGTPIGLSVYQDGVRVNEPFGDIVNWDLIPQNAIARTTIIPGSNPLFGLNTLGGSINVQTKDGLHNPGTQAEVYGGSWGRRAVEAENGGSLDNGFNWFLAGNSFAEDGWRQSSPSNVQQAFGKFGWKGKKADFETTFTAADNVLTGLGYTPQSMLNMVGWNTILSAPDTTRNQLGSVTAKGGYHVMEDIYLSSLAYFRSSNTTTANGNVNGDYGSLSPNNYPYGAIIGGVDFNESATTYTSTQQNGTGVVVQVSFDQYLSGHKNQFITGVSYDYAGVDFDQTHAEGGLTSDRVTTNTYPAIDQVRLIGSDGTLALFATENFSITEDTHLTLSGRYNDNHVSTSDLLNPPGPHSLSGDQSFQSFNPAIGLAHNFNDDLNIYGGFNQSSRAPSAIEIGCSNPQSPCVLPNALAGDPPLLKQVIAQTWEGGLRGKLMQNINWNFDGYRTVSRDDIEFSASNTSGSGYFANVGQTLRQGIDVGVQAKTGNFNFSLGYSFIAATYQSSFQIANDVNSSSFFNGTGTQVIQVNKGDSIPGIPQHQFKLRGEWQTLPEWTIAADLLVFSSQYAHGDENNADPSGKIPGYAVVNLDTRYTVPHTGWQIFANINNLFNTHYANAGLLGQNNFYSNGQFRNDGSTSAEPFLSPGSPLAIWIGIKWKFGEPIL